MAVVRIVVPRPDFPQQGWLDKPVGTLFEAYSGWQVPPVEELSSFRTVHWRDAVGSRERQLLYTDFPQHGWIIYGAKRLPEVLHWAPVDCQMRTFRVSSRLEQNAENRQWSPDYPEQTWLNPNRYDLGTRWPAIETGSDFSYQMPKSRFTVSPGDWWQKLDWINGAISFYDSSLFPSSVQQLSSFLTNRSIQDRSNMLQDQPVFDWLVPSVIYDPKLSPTKEELLRAFCTRPQTGGMWRFDQPQFDWIIPTVIADPVLSPIWTHQLQSFRMARPIQLRSVDQPNVDWLAAILGQFTPSMWPAVELLAHAFRTANLPSVWLAPQPNVDWVDAVLSQFDPKYWPALESLLRSYRSSPSSGLLVLPSWPDMGWISGLTFPVPPVLGREAEIEFLDRLERATIAVWSQQLGLEPLGTMEVATAICLSSTRVVSQMNTIESATVQVL